MVWRRVKTTIVRLVIYGWCRVELTLSIWRQIYFIVLLVLLRCDGFLRHVLDRWLCASDVCSLAIWVVFIVCAYTHSQTDTNDWQMCILRRTECVNITIIGVHSILPILTVNLHRIINSTTSCLRNHQALHLVILPPRQKYWVLGHHPAFSSVFELMKR